VSAVGMYKKITRDRNFILLNINALLVLVSYATAFLLGFYMIPYVKIIRTAFLFLSIILLLKEYPSDLFKYNSLHQNKVIWIILLLFLTTFLSGNIIFSINRTFTFVVPFVYIFFNVKLLVKKYGQKLTLIAFCSSMNYIYLIPIISFFLSGGNLGLNNIYGSAEDGFIFVSNHFGWSSAIFLLTAMDYHFNFRPEGFRKKLLILFGLISMYLLLISGSRSALLSVGLAAIFFFLYNKKANTVSKLVLVLMIFAFTTFYIGVESSALNERYDVSIEQAEEGESRLVMMNAGLELFSRDPTNWIFGLGLFNYDVFENKNILESYHNSYFEILFGGGVFIFLLFFIVFVYQPLKNYFLYFKNNFLIIFPIMIIPFFESNLTGGQFLFYPWFIFSILFSVKRFKPKLVNNNLIHQNSPQRESNNYC